jgi:hypothetical protein
MGSRHPQVDAPGDGVEVGDKGFCPGERIVSTSGKALDPLVAKEAFDEELRAPDVGPSEVDLARQAPGVICRPGEVGGLAVAEAGGGGNGLDRALVEQVLTTWQLDERSRPDSVGDRARRGRPFAHKRRPREAVAGPEAEEAALGGGGEAPEHLGEHLGVRKVQPALAWSLAPPWRRRLRLRRRQGDGVELGVGA